MIVTQFPNTSAQSLQVSDLSWDDLVKKILKPKAFTTKTSMPLIKLAKFGDVRSGKNSLRHDANIVEVYGLEGDYDGEEITIDEAATRLRKHGIRAALYTSPSHSPDKPRWRVLAPFSALKEPNERHHLMGLLNAALGGILAKESFTLSQTYYFGKASSDYEAIEVQGLPIDLKDGLWSPVYSSQAKIESMTFEVATLRSVRIADAIRQLYDNKAYYQPSLSLAAMLCKSGLSKDDAIATVKAILEAHPNPNGDIDKYIAHVDGFLTGEGFDVQMPRNEGIRGAEYFSRGAFIYSTSEFIGNASAPEFIVEKVIQRGQVYSFCAKWGHGKTALMLTWAIHIAAGLPFAGFQSKRSKILYLAGENPADVQLRVISICEEFGINLTDLDGWLYFSDKAFPINDTLIREYFVTEVTKVMDAGVDLILVDTGMAHSEIEEENSNSTMHKLAVAMRDMAKELTDAGLVVFMHPTQGATQDTLRSRGGGAFAGQIDGELLAWQDEVTKQIKFWHSAKFRGGGFAPVYFDLKKVDVEGYDDNFGNKAVSVVAIPAIKSTATTTNQLKGNTKAVYDVFLRCATTKTLVRDAEWSKESIEVLSADSIESRKRAYWRSRKELVEKGMVLNGNQPGTYQLPLLNTIKEYDGV